jgi:hypothetical protein
MRKLDYAHNVFRVSENLNRLTVRLDVVIQKDRRRAYVNENAGLVKKKPAGIPVAGCEGEKTAQDEPNQPATDLQDQFV